jgi:tetratricopeptide (TPR) repeat protein
MSELIDHVELTMAGFRLTDSKAKLLEKRLEEDPADLYATYQLIGYYFGKPREKSFCKSRARLTIWLIDNYPQAPVLGESWVKISNVDDQQSYDEIKQHWLNKLDSLVDDVVVFGNAARYYTHHDPLLSERFIHRAIELEPEEPNWSQFLATTLRQQGPSRATDALAAIQSAIAKEPDEQMRYYLYDDLAEIAFQAGNLVLASEAAQLCLNLAFSFGEDWNDGNAIHIGHSILGRIALTKGDLVKAKEHLALAGATKGSPQLNSFGPRMELAQELLKAGEPDAVIHYLEDCKKFWEPDCEQGRLTKLISEILNGELPAFP